MNEKASKTSDTLTIATAEAPREPWNQWTVICPFCEERLPIGPSHIDGAAHETESGTIHQFAVVWPSEQPQGSPVCGTRKKPECPK